MKQIPIGITKYDKGLFATSPFSNKNICTQYDNLAQEFLVIRPEDYASYQLALIFSTPSLSFDPIVIGLQNTFEIPSEFTQELSLSVQAAFSVDAEIVYTNVLKFFIRPSLEQGDTPPEPPHHGPKGDNGWSPVVANVPEQGTERVVQQLVDYVGGTGTKPVEDIGKYVGSAGYVTNISDAVDVRGAEGKALESEIHGPDAPSDGVQYARQFVSSAMTWTPVENQSKWEQVVDKFVVNLVTGVESAFELLRQPAPPLVVKAIIDGALKFTDMPTGGLTIQGQTIKFTPTETKQEAVVLIEYSAIL